MRRETLADPVRLQKHLETFLMSPPPQPTRTGDPNEVLPITLEENVRRVNVVMRRIETSLARIRRNLVVPAAGAVGVQETGAEGAGPELEKQPKE